jgi:hypothetical protein
MGRLVNHVELVHRPGERRLAAAFFELLGCKVVETGGPFLVVHVDPGTRDPAMLDNCFYVSEMTAGQVAFERGLAAAEDALSVFVADRRRRPQHTTHFGISMDTESWERTIGAVAGAATEHPELRGRVELAGVYRPGDPGSLSPTLLQAFVATDVCAAGLVAMGQYVELQARVG